MKLLARSLLAISLGVPVAAIGRMVGTVEPASAAPIAAAPIAAAEDPLHAGHHHHGIRKFIAKTLAALDLTPEQKSAVDSLGHLVMTSAEDAHAKKHDLVLALADQLAAGHVDRQALASKVDAFAAAVAQLSPVKHNALDEFHRILTPEQRGRFADIVEGALEDTAIAQHVDALFDEASARLALTPDQKGAFQAALSRYQPALQAHREIFDRVLEAFRADTFSVNEVLPAFDAEEHARAVANAAIDLTETAVTILTPEQRTQIADIVHRHIEHEHEHCHD